ncbi:hypothetical protein VNO78_17614 [Psophocarpus tetragonolobus]|uniref:Uncharacterized protein n=1 Tax=Psophocarpus tetragonolobus TaxID=3891 RepID=A0AAN9XLH0_PSOTE
MIFSEIFNHDITTGRPKLGIWIQEANKIDGYKKTKVDRQQYLEAFKKKFMFAKYSSCLYSVGLTMSESCCCTGV